MGLLLSSSRAQVPNDTLYQCLLGQYFTEHPGPYRSLMGLGEAFYPDSLVLDTTARVALTVLSAEVSYVATTKDRYLRRVEIPLQIETEGLRSETLVATDTLDRKQLRWVLRHSSRPLQGEDPRQWTRRWGPALALVPPLLITTLLFVWRSP